jgi:hypothetical protein
MSASFKVLVKAKLVNCEACRSGVIASSGAVTQKSATIVFDSLHARTLRLNQSMIATGTGSLCASECRSRLRTRPGSAGRWSNGEAGMAMSGAADAVRSSSGAGRSAPNPSCASGDGCDGAQRTSRGGADAVPSAASRTSLATPGELCPLVPK